MRIRLLLCVLCLNLMLLCCSCGFFGPQKYVCEVDDVASVQIIRLEEYVEGEYRYEYTILAQISNYRAFVDRLNNLKHSVNWGEPGWFPSQCVAIRIDYNNGDFDLLHPSKQWLNRGGVNQDGYFFFDKEQFHALISEYWTE